MQLILIQSFLFEEPFFLVKDKGGEMLLHSCRGNKGCWDRMVCLDLYYSGLFDLNDGVTVLIFGESVDGS